MSEQKQFGQLVGMMIQNLPEMTAEQMQKLIGNPKGVQKFLSGLVGMVTPLVRFITATFHDKINYDRSINDSVEAGKYGCHDPNITDINFSSTETGEREVEYVMFYFTKAMISKEVTAQIISENCHIATMKELLSFGEKHPDLQREYPIVALGSVIDILDYQQVGCLYGADSGREIYLYSFDSIWNDSCRFLGVRF